MTVENTDNVVVYTGNGATTSFDFDFLIPTEEELVGPLYQIATGVEEGLDPGE